MGIEPIRTDPQLACGSLRTPSWAAWPSWHAPCPSWVAPSRRCWTWWRTPLVLPACAAAGAARSSTQATRRPSCGHCAARTVPVTCGLTTEEANILIVCPLLGWAACTACTWASRLFRVSCTHAPHRVLTHWQAPAGTAVSRGVRSSLSSAPPCEGRGPGAPTRRVLLALLRARCCCTRPRKALPRCATLHRH